MHRGSSFPKWIGALALGATMALPRVAAAQVPVGPVEQDPPETYDRREQPVARDEEFEAEKRRRREVRPDGPSDEEANPNDDGSYDDRYPDEHDPEYAEEYEEDRGGGRRRRRSSGTSARTVGLVLSVSGLIVGLGGGAVSLAGSAAEDKPTIITGAVIGLTGAALGVTGLIINLTAGSGGRAAAEPTFVVGFGPGSATLSGSF